MRYHVSDFRDVPSALLVVTLAVFGLLASALLIYVTFPNFQISILFEVSCMTAIIAAMVAYRREARPVEDSFPKKKMHPQAVIGFVDMTSSSALTNLVGISRDWEIKQKFFKVAVDRAEDCGMTVLNHTGDGFLFIANFGANSDWQFNIIAFFETLALDFEHLRKTELHEGEDLETGIRFGLALGPAVIGLISGAPSFFTAVGADVNLAARLTAVAANDQLVLTSRIWHSLKPLLIGWDAEEEKHKVKGFADPIPVVRIKRRLATSARTCVICGGPLVVKRTDEGEIKVSCSSSHGHLRHSA